MTDLDVAAEPGPDDPDDDEEGDEVASGRGLGPIIASAVVLAVVAVLVVVLATRKPAADRLTDSPLLGHPAPAFSGPTLGGDTFSLDTAAGKVVFVNFLASWCGPCQQEHAALKAFAERHEAIGDAEVVSVVYDDNTPDVRAYFAERGGSWPVVIGDDGSIALDYGVLKVPETFVVAPDGTVLARFAGAVTEAGLEAALARVEGTG